MKIVNTNLKQKIMNKIERAIYDTKLHISNLERDELILSTELKAFKKQLNALEAIEWDKTIPHVSDDFQIKPDGAYESD